MKRVYQIPKADWDELMRLSKVAHQTPVMLVGGVDVSSAAWRNVQDRWRGIAASLNIRFDSIEPHNEALRQIKAEPLGVSS